MKHILTGIAANKGKVKGPAFVIKTEQDLAKFKAGSILIAKTTNPIYVTAMTSSIGIITDIGAITSHAGIVARELGLPCIVGTKHGTTKIKTGQKIILDANHGLIYDCKK